MHNNARVLALAGLIISSASQAEPVKPFYITPSATYHFLDSDGNVNDMGSIGLNLGYQFHPSWAVELGLRSGSTDSTFGDDVDYTSYQVDGLYLFNPPGRWQPYVVVSVMNQSFKADETRRENVSAAGVGSYYAFSDRFRIRSDIRGLYSASDNLIDSLVNVGFEIRFGGKSATTTQAQPAPQQAAPVVVAPVVLKPAPTHIVTFHFDSDSTTVSNTHKSNLSEIAEYMQKYPDATLVIEGDADSTGSEANNIILSKQRAESVEHIIEQDYGIAKKRITVKALGESHPVADNSTQQGRAENRRVDLRLRVHHETK